MTDEPRRTPTPEVGLVSYRDGELLVICDPSDPRAWIASDVSRTLDDAVSGPRRVESA